MPVSMQPGNVGPQLPQVPRGPGDGGLPNLSEQELLMLQQTSQTSQSHGDISFWLDWVRLCVSRMQALNAKLSGNVGSPCRLN